MIFHVDYVEEDIYYDIGGDFTHMYSMTYFDEHVIEWLKRYEVSLQNLPLVTIAIVEPLDKNPYKRFISNIRRRFGRQTFRFVELIFRLRKGNREYRGVLVGRFFTNDNGSISIMISNSYWINEPPIGENP